MDFSIFYVNLDESKQDISQNCKTCNKTYVKFIVGSFMLVDAQAQIGKY